MRAAALAMLVLAGCAAGSQGVPVLAGPTVADQTWVGLITCEVMPRVQTKRLQQAFRLEVRGGIGRYDRSVLMPDTTNDSGFHENGEGGVRSDGAVSLTGQGYAETAQFRSEYSGTLPQSGGATELTGMQHWQFHRLPPYDRSCSIALHRI